MTYAEIQALEPEAYLNPDNFKTIADGWPEKGYSDKQYQKGLKTGQESKLIIITARGTWCAAGKDGSMTTSYEGIGYHSCTAPLLKGFLDSGCQIAVYRHGVAHPIK